MKEVVFYYDVVCPFAFMASKLIEGVARRTGAKIHWKPVLLGKWINMLSPDERMLIWRHLRWAYVFYTLVNCQTLNYTYTAKIQKSFFFSTVTWILAITSFLIIVGLLWGWGEGCLCLGGGGLHGNEYEHDFHTGWSSSWFTLLFTW